MLMNKNDEAEYFDDYFLDGLYSDHLLQAMKCEICWDLGFCGKCDTNYKCHVLLATDEENTWEKLCPILFHDVLQPKWQIKDLA